MNTDFGRKPFREPSETLSRTVGNPFENRLRDRKVNDRILLKLNPLA